MRLSRLSRFTATVAPLLALWGAGPTGAAERPWIEVKTPNFVVVANTGQGDARDMGWQFEQVRAAFALLWPWAHRESGRPFVVFALRSESDLRSLAPEYWEKGGDGVGALAVTGRDKDYFALPAGIALPDNMRTNPYFYAYWGFTTQMLEASFPGRLPPWYQRGLADFFANTLVLKKQVQVGRFIDHHVRKLAQLPHMSVAEIVGADWKSPWLTDDDRKRTFDAHAWMLVHYLTLGENSVWLPKFNRFAELLKQGVKADAAFAQAMGDVPAVSRGFANYIGRELYTLAAFNTDVNVKPEGFSVRNLTASEALALRAGFHVAMNRPAEARALLAEARKAEPPSVVTDEVEAILLDNEDKDKEALELYTRAAKGGSTNFYVYFREGSMRWQKDEPKEVMAEVAAAYTEAVRLNPDHARAQDALARALSDLEPGERAIAAARKAMALEPGVVAHRLALTKALYSAGKRADAKSEAERSLALATEVDDRADAQRWIDYIARATAAAQPPPAPSAAPALGSPEWLAAAQKACDEGKAEACGALGSVFLNGTGVAKDPRQSLVHLQQACALSELRACAFAGHMTFQGSGVAKNLAEATRMSTQACDGGELSGCTTLALIHVQKGTPAALTQARGLLKKSCDGGESNACGLLKSLPK